MKRTSITKDLCIMALAYGVFFCMLAAIDWMAGTWYRAAVGLAIIAFLGCVAIAVLVYGAYLEQMRDKPAKKRSQ